MPAIALASANAAKGHQALAELLASVMRTAMHNVEAAGGPAAVLARDSSNREAAQRDVPPPMIPGNMDAATTVCAMQVRCCLSNVLHSQCCMAPRNCAVPMVAGRS